jgi:hypothetical protein
VRYLEVAMEALAGIRDLFKIGAEAEAAAPEEEGSTAKGNFDRCRQN